MKVRIGTRGSKLALWQAHFVQNMLEKKGLETEIVIITTKGDKIQDRSLSKIGSKGVFTEELEQQLREQKIDIAVHSAKDVPSRLPKELPLIAFTKRELTNDVLVSLKANISLDQKDLVVGTSSTRRVALLRHYYPHVKTVDMRGNLQTRMQKLKDGHCDALILAYAGVHRMNYHDNISERLSLDTFVPAVGQGSVAIQIFDQCEPSLKAKIKDAINDPLTETCLSAEREFLKVLEGGCSIPVFGLATPTEEGIHFRCGIVSLDGKEMIKLERNITMENPKEIAAQLAKELLEKGGDAILKEIRSTLDA